MIYLQVGDTGPLVVAVQALLNRKRSPEGLGITGVFDAVTRAAVTQFQKGQRARIRADGIVGPSTWSRLVEDQSLSVVDAVDVTDPRALRAEAAALRMLGGSPLLTGGMCNGVADVVDLIVATARRAGRIVLLRFHGHGRSGVVGVSIGEGGVETATLERGALSLASLPVLAGTLSSLRACFAPFGSVELHGCRTGAGPDGPRFLVRLAALWRVPVTAGVSTQIADAGLKTLRFEGSTICAYPDNGSLASWARSFEKTMTCE